MNKFIAKVLKSAGVNNAKVSKDNKNPRFKVVENKLTLEGIVKPNRYAMTIKDNTGKQIDKLSVVIQNSNDVVNRISESLQTLHLLSENYDSNMLKEEDEEFDEIVVDEDAPANIIDGLDNLYDSILDVAEQAEALVDVADDNDAEQINAVIGLASSLYDCAIDVDDLKSDLIDEDEDIDEGLSRVVSKSDVEKALNSLTMAESLLRKNRNYSDIYTAIKDIKSELIVRGK